MHKRIRFAYAAIAFCLPICSGCSSAPPKITKPKIIIVRGYGVAVGLGPVVTTPGPAQTTINIGGVIVDDDGSSTGVRWRASVWIDDDGDGIVDLGEDTNGNGVLDPGEDTDGDGVLDPPEIKVQQSSTPPPAAAPPGWLDGTGTTCHRYHYSSNTWTRNANEGNGHRRS